MTQCATLCVCLCEWVNVKKKFFLVHGIGARLHHNAGPIDSRKERNGLQYLLHSFTAIQSRVRELCDTALWNRCTHEKKNVTMQRRREREREREKEKERQGKRTTKSSTRWWRFIFNLVVVAGLAWLGFRGGRERKELNSRETGNKMERMPFKVAKERLSLHFYLWPDGWMAHGNNLRNGALEGTLFFFAWPLSLSLWAYVCCSAISLGLCCYDDTAPSDGRRNCNCS